MVDKNGDGTIDTCAFLDIDQIVEYYAITFVYADGGNEEPTRPFIGITLPNGDAVAEEDIVLTEGGYTLWGQNYDLYTVTVPAGTSMVNVGFDSYVAYQLLYSTEDQDDDSGNGVETVPVMVDKNGDGTIDTCAFLDYDQIVEYYAITFVYADGGNNTVPEEKIEISEASGIPIATVNVLC